MSFKNIKLPSYQPKEHLPPSIISEELNRMYGVYYSLQNQEKELNIIEEFYDKCEIFFNQNKKYYGLNKQGEACVLGFTLSYYNRGGIIYEPIIFNLDKSEYVKDYKRMGLNKETYEDYENINGESYKRLENILFVFADNKQYYQFNFHKDNLYNKKTIPQMVQTLKSNCFKNYLDLSLPQKDEHLTSSPP